MSSKRIFLGYRFTGEDPKELADFLGKISAVLREQGYKVYSTIEDEDGFKKENRTRKEIAIHAFEKLDQSDVILALIRSEEKSEGLILEIGYMLAKNKPVIVAVQKGLKQSTITELANSLIEFDSIEDLCQKLKVQNF